MAIVGNLVLFRRTVSLRLTFHIHPQQKRKPSHNNLLVTLVPLRRSHEFLVYVVLSINDNAEPCQMHSPNLREGGAYTC